VKLIAEKRGVRDKLDDLLFVRQDGSTTRCQLPRQGTLPHDLIHYVVESRLPFRNGFLGLVASGSDAEFVLKMVHDKQNPQVETEAVQVESIVEALQTQLWAGSFEAGTFLEAAALAAEARGTVAFSFGEFDPKEIYERCMLLLDQWNSVPFFGKLELEFKAGADRSAQATASG